MRTNVKEVAAKGMAGVMRQQPDVVREVYRAALTTIGKESLKKVKELKVKSTMCSGNSNGIKMVGTEVEGAE